MRSDDTRPAQLGISDLRSQTDSSGAIAWKPLPRDELQLQREKKAPPLPALDANFARRFPLRLLLADDNPINQKVGLSVLQKLGYRADVARTARSAEGLEQKPYDVVFLDVQMPEMDGLEAARQICQRWPESQTPAHHRHDRQRAHGRPRKMSGGGHG